MKVHKRLGGAGIALLVLATSVGCTGDGDSGAGSAVSASSEPSQGRADAVASPRTPLAVEGRDYEVVDTLRHEVNGRSGGYFGTTSNGIQVWAADGMAMDPDEPEDPRGMALVTRDTSSGRTAEVARHGTPEQWVQIPAVAIDGNRAVWIETPSTSMYEMPWEMYTYDVNTGKESHLASSDFFGIDNPPWPWLQGIVPHVEGKFVYFPAVDEVRKSDPAGRGRASVYRVPLSGGDPEIIAKGAIEVFGDRNGKLQMRFPDRIVQWDPSRGTEGEVAGTSLPAQWGSFAHEGVRVAIHDAERIRIQKPDGEEVRIDVETGAVDDDGEERKASVGYLNATSRWVSFTVDVDARQRGYLYDLERDVLLRLEGVENSSSTRLSGNVYDLQKRWKRGIPRKTSSLIRLLPR